MPSIKIPTAIEARIREVVNAARVETGVTLFGRKVGDVFEVLEICGPGPAATHQEFHYSGDNGHASDFYNELLKTQPDLKHIGEFHVHPLGMRHLSGGDLRTIKKVLKTYEEFVAGVMLRNNGKVDFYPMYFARGKEGIAMEVIRDLLNGKYIAVVGLGSGGSALADMLARAGVAALTLIDPDQLTQDNVQRHVLTRISCGQAKVTGMAAHIRAINPDCRTTLLADRFTGFSEKPDLIACCADSDACCQLVNQYALEHKIPVVFGGVHGAAEMAEIITLVPGLTPCYACYEREGPSPEPSMEKYTNPNYDPTQMPHQEGLWCDVLMAASIQFRAILEVIEVQERIVAANKSRRERGIIYGCFGELWSDMNPLILTSLRPPYGSEIIKQKERCAVCSNDFAKLSV